MCKIRYKKIEVLVFGAFTEGHASQQANVLNDVITTNGYAMYLPGK